MQTNGRHGESWAGHYKCIKITDFNLITIKRRELFNMPIYIFQVSMYIDIEVDLYRFTFIH